jgi:hypothetical protein
MVLILLCIVNTLNGIITVNNVPDPTKGTRIHGCELYHGLLLDQDVAD